MKDEIMLLVADFSKYPSGRDDLDGSFNGEKYRRTVLIPALNAAIEAKRTVCVSLKGVMSFGSSFLEEAFGGLVRKEGFSKQQLKEVLRIDSGKSNLQRYENAIWTYIQTAE
ncbi:MAG: STAS-like domain-containing protein [Bacteroides sp.]|nr:STAS-like domain-containing protein [Bacteroides sp.]